MSTRARVINISAPVIVVFLLIVICQISCTVFDISFHFLPKPTEVAAALVRNFADIIFPDMLISLRIMLTGYLIAVPLGFLIAAFSSQFKIAVNAITPVLIILMVTPMATLVPIFKLLWGVKPFVKVLIVILQCTPVIAVNSLSGFIHVPGEKKELMKALGCGKWESFFRVTIPNALPQIFTGLKLGCILCTIAAMSADISVGQGGLGYRITVSSAQSATDTAYATILVVAIIGVALYMLVTAIESKIVTWKK